MPLSEGEALEAEKRRLARESRLAALGFEEVPPEHKKINIDLNIAPVVEWPNAD